MPKKKAVLSAEDEKKIAAGEFFISEVETLRLQRLDALCRLWAERGRSAQRDLAEAETNARKYSEQLRAEIDALKSVYGLGDNHGVDLADESCGKVFALPQGQER